MHIWSSPWRLVADRQPDHNYVYKLPEKIYLYTIILQCKKIYIMILKIKGPDNPTCYQLLQTQTEQRKREGKRKYESDGGTMVVCMQVCMQVGEFVCVCGEQTVGVPDILNTILCLTHIQNNLRPAPRNPRPWLLRRLRYAFWRLCCVSLLLTEPGFGSLSKRWCAHHTSADQSNVLHSFERSRTFCELFLHALWLVNIAGT